MGDLSLTNLCLRPLQAKAYSPRMSFRSRRTWIATIMAALLVFSSVAHHAVAAGMSSESGMAMPAATADMASHDGMPCPSSSDCSNDMGMHAMACFAHCSTVLGVLADWVAGSATTIARPMRLPATPPLTSLHRPPEPHPPKS
jgi:hypothetical protein